MRDDVPMIPVGKAALFLDLDGTIVPIAPEPDQVRAGTPCRLVLARAIDELGGRLAVISGRTLESVDEVLGGLVRSVAGVHGLQRRNPRGEVVLQPPHARVADATAVLTALAQARHGLMVEAKGSAVAIHYRAAPEAEAAVLETAHRLAEAAGLEIQLGKMVAELRTPGPDKGSALSRFMLEAPFNGATPIFIGDDLTDEAGFAAARAHGGFGLLVGEPRATLADGVIATPAAALAWIMLSLDDGRFDLDEASSALQDTAGLAGLTTASRVQSMGLS